MESLADCWCKEQTGGADETCCLLERVRNAKDHISFTLDMGDYYRIKDEEKSQGGSN